MLGKKFYTSRFIGLLTFILALVPVYCLYHLKITDDFTKLYSNKVMFFISVFMLLIDLKLLLFSLKLLFNSTLFYPEFITSLVKTGNSGYGVPAESITGMFKANENPLVIENLPRSILGIAERISRDINNTSYYYRFVIITSVKSLIDLVIPVSIFAVINFSKLDIPHNLKNLLMASIILQLFLKTITFVGEFMEAKLIRTNEGLFDYFYRSFLWNMVFTGLAYTLYRFSPFVLNIGLYRETLYSLGIYGAMAFFMIFMGILRRPIKIRECEKVRKDMLLNREFEGIYYKLLNSLEENRRAKVYLDQKPIFRNYRVEGKLIFEFIEDIYTKNLRLILPLLLLALPYLYSFYLLGISYGTDHFPHMELLVLMLFLVTVSYKLISVVGNFSLEHFISSNLFYIELEKLQDLNKADIRVYFTRTTSSICKHGSLRKVQEFYIKDRDEELVEGLINNLTSDTLSISEKEQI